MLDTISWNEFLAAFGFLTGAYYAASGLLLCNKELIALIRGKNSLFPSTAETHPNGDLMGKVRQEPSALSRKSLIDADQIYISSPDPSESPIENPGPAGKSTASAEALMNLLHELETLAEVISLNTNSGDENVSLFQSLVSRYPQLVGTVYQNAVSQIIQATCKGKCGHDLELSDIESWWKDHSADNY